MHQQMDLLSISMRWYIDASHGYGDVVDASPRCVYYLIVDTILYASTIYIDASIQIVDASTIYIDASIYIVDPSTNESTIESKIVDVSIIYYLILDASRQYTYYISVSMRRQAELWREVVQKLRGEEMVVGMTFFSTRV